ncbi:hypothetical protein [Brevundimonas goettingensis]|nr:hypothetical protein [Brevundimonas goettingensis]
MAPTVLVLAGLLWFGQREDRLGAAVFVSAILAPPLLEPLVIGNIRWGLGLMSIGLLASLIALVVVSRRWWIIAAAGFQVAATSSYAIALAQPDLLIWTGVSLRLVLWMLQMVACGFGIAEALSARRQTRSHFRAKARPLSTEYHP